jgi:hypothetical protein
MALPRYLEILKIRLEALPSSRRTTEQNGLLEELKAIDQGDIRKAIVESSHTAVTRMTSPGNGGCPCCGR